MKLTTIIYSIYGVTHSYKARSLLRQIVSKFEKGDLYSVTLRKILKNYHNIEIGMYSYGGCFSVENIPSGTSFGRYCSIARNVFVLNGNHPTRFVSLHPFFYNPKLGYVNKLFINRSNLIIENDVWIGQNAIILPSVNKIENGAVIGAGSVVTKNVPAYAVVVGNPARVIKFRFSPEKIKRILNSEWWKYDIEQLKLNEFEAEAFS